MAYKGKYKDAHEPFWQLTNELLEDEHGISEQSYSYLKALGNVIGAPLVPHVDKLVDATDGRFYYKDSPERPKKGG
jgi:hypothetical protein